MTLWTCPTCKGTGRVSKNKASKRKGEGSETVMEDCTTCDGAGQLESPPA